MAKEEYSNLKKFGLSAVDVAEAMGYKNVRALRSSSAYRRVMEGVDVLLGDVLGKVKKML